VADFTFDFSFSPTDPATGEPRSKSELAELATRALAQFQEIMHDDMAGGGYLSEPEDIADQIAASELPINLMTYIMMAFLEEDGFAERVKKDFTKEVIAGCPEFKDYDAEATTWVDDISLLCEDGDFSVKDINNHAVYVAARESGQNLGLLPPNLPPRVKPFARPSHPPPRPAVLLVLTPP
jgi:hypothetical protein